MHVYRARNADRVQKDQSVDREKRPPSVAELYKEQWPDAQAPSSADWRAALNATRDLVAQTLTERMQHPIHLALLQNLDSIVQFPVPDPDGPEVSGDEQVFTEDALQLLEKLAAALVSNPIRPLPS